jgi:Flp pilus assembly protein TadG
MSRNKFLTHGQSMVEFALMLPLFILVILGFFGMTVMFFSYVSAGSAAREGARYLVGNPQTGNTQVQNYICTTNPILSNTATCLARSIVTNDKSTCTNSTAYDICMVIEPASNRIQGTLLTVTIRYHTPIPTLGVSFFGANGFTFLGPIWVESASVMRVE